MTADLGCFAGGEHPVTAELIADPENGTSFAGRVVVWPTGFTGRRAGSEVEVLDASGTVRATTGRRYHIATAALYPYTDTRFPAAVNCDYPWDFGECDANGTHSEYCEGPAPST